MKILLPLLILLAAVSAKLKHCKQPGVYSNGSEICLECDTEYYLNTSDSLTKCKECFHNCDICSYAADTDIYVCHQCENGHRLAANSSSECVSCPDHCKTCDQHDVCLLCDDGADLENGKCEKHGFWGWFFAIVIIVALIGAGYFLYNKYYVPSRAGVYSRDIERDVYENQGPSPTGRRD